MCAHAASLDLNVFQLMYINIFQWWETTDFWQQHLALSRLSRHQAPNFN
jgi:hypothetical protein